MQDLVNSVLYEDLRDFVLLGYSYGGAVVTGAVAHISDRIRELVYLDAFVPSDGDTVSGLSGRDTAARLFSAKDGSSRHHSANTTTPGKPHGKPSGACRTPGAVLPSQSAFRSRS